MQGQKVLQGLRHAVRPQGTPRPPVVLDMKTDPIYQPMQPTMFFVDGSIAQSCHEPRLICDDYRIKLKHPKRRATWVRVSPAAYRRAVVGEAFTG